MTNITLNKKERKQFEVTKKFINKEITIKEAMLELKISRQSLSLVSFFFIKEGKLPVDIHLKIVTF